VSDRALVPRRICLPRFTRDGAADAEIEFIELPPPWGSLRIEEGSWRRPLFIFAQIQDLRVEILNREDP